MEEKCIKCITDKKTGECYSIKDEKARELIAELQNNAGGGGGKYFHAVTIVSRYGGDQYVYACINYICSHSEKITSYTEMLSCVPAGSLVASGIAYGKTNGASDGTLRHIMTATVTSDKLTLKCAPCEEEKEKATAGVNVEISAEAFLHVPFEFTDTVTEL